MADSLIHMDQPSGDNTGKNKNSRCISLQIILILLFSILLYRLFELQVINGRNYADNFELQITRTVRDHNTRGAIYDRNGEALAYSELVYTVTMTDNGAYSSEREHQLTLNSLIYSIVKKLSENGEQINISIDKNLQIAVYHILEQNLAGIIASNLVNAKRFDKTHISDTSDIRIPIYDVYFALVDNSVIRLSDLYSADATELERHIAETLKAKKEEVSVSLQERIIQWKYSL